MSSPFGSRLIWESSGPAPFESGWSILLKLLLLNGMKSNLVDSLISIPTRLTTKNSSLNFRSSAWIDFDRFSDAIGVEQKRLRSAFLDQLGFPIEPHTRSRGIKHCRVCLGKGYHCVLFELGFIDICPWHGEKLEEPCPHCAEAVLHARVAKQQGQGREHGPSEFALWDQWKARCEHIFYSEDKTSRSIQYTLIEQKMIAESCRQLLGWCRAVSNNAGIAQHLFQPDFQGNKLDYLNKFINAAEAVAGPCPWPIRHSKKAIRSQIWSHNPQKDILYAREYDAPRKSEWDIAYRTIRRNLFKKYVNTHRRCWNEMSNYDRTEVLRMDSDTVCPVSLAYAIWRLSCEQFTNIEAFKVGSLREHPIRIFQLDQLGIYPSIRAFAYLLYAQFFYIWEEVLQYAGTWEFAVYLKRHLDNDDFVILSIPPIGSSIEEAVEEWTVIIPDSRLLERKSLVTCSGKLMKPGWMIYPGWISDWHINAMYERNFGNGVVFRLRKKSFRKRSSYYYMNVS